MQCCSSPTASYFQMNGFSRPSLFPPHLLKIRLAQKLSQLLMPTKREHVEFPEQRRNRRIRHGSIPLDSCCTSHSSRPVETRQYMHRGQSRWDGIGIIFEFTEAGSKKIRTIRIKDDKQWNIRICGVSRIAYINITIAFIMGTEIIRRHENFATQNRAIGCRCRCHNRWRRGRG